MKTEQLYSETGAKKVKTESPLKLAERCADVYRRIESIAQHPTLSADGQTRAMALLLSVNADLLPKCAAALRTVASPKQHHQEGL